MDPAPSERAISLKEWNDCFSKGRMLYPNGSIRNPLSPLDPFCRFQYSNKKECPLLHEIMLEGGLVGPDLKLPRKPPRIII